MALGNPGGNQSNSNLIFLSPRGKDKLTGEDLLQPLFFTRRKIDGKWEDAGTVDRFSGTLTNVDLKLVEMKAPAEPMQLVVLTIEDKDAGERYVVDFNLKVSTRSLYNRLLGLEHYDGLEISMFRNKDGYEVLVLRQNGDVAKPKYVKDDPAVPLVEVITKKSGKQERDYFEVNEFYLKALKALGEKLKPAPSPSAASEASPNAVPAASPNAAPAGKASKKAAVKEEMADTDF